MKLKLLAAAIAAAALSACSTDAGSPASAEPDQRPSPAAAADPLRKPKAVIEPKSGPFGLEMGLSLSDVKQLFGKPPTHEETGFLTFDTAPIPYGPLARYSVVVAPVAGLCKVIGGAEVESNSYGHQVRESVSGLVEALTDKYGAPTDSLDRTLPRTIWDEPRDFMMGLVKKERSLIYAWDSEKTELPSSLASISVSATGLTSSVAYVSLAYEFTNMDDCIEEDRKANNVGL